MRWTWTAGLILLTTAASSTSIGQQFRNAPPAKVGNSGVSHLLDVDKIRKELGLLPAYQKVGGFSGVRVAVLDHGFDGLGVGRGYLPDDAEVVEHYEPDWIRQSKLGDPDYRKPFEPGNRHGRVMAQLIWAMTGSHPDGPKFYLLNANGPTMLRRAVRYAIDHKVDILLFSGSFEGGGNYDGRGSIDRIAAEAVSAGIVWVNAAGNYGRKVFNGPLRLMPDGYLKLRRTADVASLRFRNRVDENTVVVTLTWNDYRDDEDAGTQKDLDLFVEDWTGRRVGESTKTQIWGDRPPGPEETRNPRERVTLENLAANPDIPSDNEYGYRIRVRTKGGHFTGTDRIRILVTGSKEFAVPDAKGQPVEALDFVDATGEGEIYPPADHPLVVTVGDPSPLSSIGPTADRRIKPDVLLADSRAVFSDGQVSDGSSNAAAYFAGVVATLKAVEPGLTPEGLLRMAHKIARTPPKAKAGARPVDTGRSGLQFWKTPGPTTLGQALKGEAR